MFLHIIALRIPVENSVPSLNGLTKNRIIPLLLGYPKWQSLRKHSKCWEAGGPEGALFTPCEWEGTLSQIIQLECMIHMKQNYDPNLLLLNINS